MIFISAGHNAKRKGAKYKGVSEFDLTVPWAELIVDKLHGFGELVPSGTLTQKTQWINRQIAERRLNSETCIAVEVHFNAAISPKTGNNVGTGSETLCHGSSKGGRVVAVIVQSAMGKIFHPDRGIRVRNDLWFLRKTLCPAIIIEPEFIHRQDVIAAKKQWACKRIAQALFRAQGDLEKIDKAASNT